MRKHQVFVSSTFTDLKTEREGLQWELLKAGYIPVGMESFAASNDRGWGIITRTIDQSDYHVLVVAGKYGSVDPKAGLSWTELEYEYALAHQVPALVFIRSESSIHLDQSERDQAARQRLADFVRKLRSVHLCAEWTDPASLNAAVIKALRDSIVYDEQNAPRPGWFRGSKKGEPPPRADGMRYYHVHLRVSGTTEECEAGNCTLTYMGSGVREAPTERVRFEDRVKGHFAVRAPRMRPEAVITNPHEYAREPQFLQYIIDGPSPLYIAGEVLTRARVLPSIGGFGLHVPHRTANVTFVVDMSACGLVPAAEVAGRLLVRDSSGIARRQQLEGLHRSEDGRVWFASAADVPADSNIEVSWGD